MKSPIRTRFRLWMLAFTMVLIPSFSSAQTYGGDYTVDGNYAEWNLNLDFHSNMFRSFNPVDPIQSRLFLHYNCETGKLFVLVLVEPKFVGILSPDDAWVAIDGISNKLLKGTDNNDGTPPDFAWVTPGYGGISGQVRGFEGSISIPPGSHRLIAHLQVYTGSSIETSGSDRQTHTDGVVLTLKCGDSYDVGVEKTVSDPTPDLNGEVDFVVTVTNHSSNPVQDVEVADQLNISAFTLINVITSQGSFSAGIWSVGTLAAGSSATLTITVEVLEETESCNTVRLTAYDHFGVDFNPANNTDEACVDPKEPVELDLGIKKSVYNAVPKIGETSVFSIVITNYSPIFPATNVLISDVLDAQFTLTDATMSTGSFNQTLGHWTLPILNPLSQATLTLTVAVQGSADNVAQLISLDQTDTNPANNSSMVSVTCSGSSGGNTGGIESDGSLAGHISSRNFMRIKSGSMNSMDQPFELIPYTKELAHQGVIKQAYINKGDTKLAELIPENGPFHSRAFVSTPEDLLQLSNALEVFSVDYFDSSAHRMGAILAMITDQGSVYNHTKLICDRLSGATLDLVRIVQINGNPFILSKLVQANGEVDYAISFISYLENDQMMVDNRWHNEEYHTAEGATIYNFQIWSVTPQSTIELTEGVLEQLGSTTTLEYRNQENPKVPSVFVSSGFYRNGSLILNLKNQAGASSISVQGSLTRAEQADRQPFKITLPVSSNENNPQVEIPVGYLFDIDLNVGNSIDRTRDGLYFADGPWGRDFDSNGTVIEEYTVEPYQGETFGDALVLERNVSAKGKTKSYFSIFRSLKPGNIPTDLSAHSNLQFQAQGTGVVTLTVTKKSIDQWSSQYRTTFTLQPNWDTYTIDLTKLRSITNSQIINLEDILSVVFTITGDGMNMNDFGINLKNLRFVPGSTLMNPPDYDGFNLLTFPNPANHTTTISFNLPADDRTRLEIRDIHGRVVMVVIDKTLARGEQRVEVNISNLDQAIYIIQLMHGWVTETRRLSIVK